MDLIARANRFIESGHVSELNPLLFDCVNSRTVEGFIAIKRLARDMYDGVTINGFFKTPASYCLLAWREEGLKALVENALEENTLKNFSLAFQILGSLASGGSPSRMTSLTIEPSLLQLIEDAVGNWADLTPLAQQQLNKLIMSINDDEDAALFTGFSLMTDSSAAKHVTLALSLRWISVGPVALRNYEQLISEQIDNEPAFQAFLSRNPLFLDPMAFNV
ncbi:hypothetical protein NDI52_17610 [Leptolyngbya sp. PL-A3]|uniref:hypothetical protein n=1 Tax=Leptolyngbya sp. PL-A3 TaxID=2933911 RepID=UPI001746DE04|nr:hypothetical protein [Phormidium tenue FACHB-886]